VSGERPDRITVACERAEGGFRCQVTVGDDAGATHHAVSLTSADLERLAPGASDPVPLVDASFRFLLEREPRESILRAFELPIIARYFPSYHSEIGKRLGG
jgi:hypothetical protein